MKLVINRKPPVRRINDLPVDLIYLGQLNGLTACDIAKIAIERRDRRVANDKAH